MAHAETAPLLAGRHAFTVTLRDGPRYSACARSRREHGGRLRGDAAPPRPRRVAAGPVSRAQGGEAEAFVRPRAAEFLNTRCGDIIPSTAARCGLAAGERRGAGPAAPREIRAGQTGGRPARAARFPDADSLARAEPHPDHDAIAPPASPTPGPSPAPAPSPSPTATPSPIPTQPPEARSRRRPTRFHNGGRARAGRPSAMAGRGRARRAAKRGRSTFPHTAASEQGLGGLLHAPSSRRTCVAARPGRCASRGRIVWYSSGDPASGRRGESLRSPARRGLRSLPLKAPPSSSVFTTASPTGDGRRRHPRPGRFAGVGARADGGGFRHAETADHARASRIPSRAPWSSSTTASRRAPGSSRRCRRPLGADRGKRRGRSARCPLGRRSAGAALAPCRVPSWFLVLTLVQYLDFRRLFERMPPEAGRCSPWRTGRRNSALSPRPWGCVRRRGSPPAKALTDVAGARSSRAASAVRSRTPRRNPLLLIAPSPPPLGAWVRWALAARRRLRLLAGTLGPRDRVLPRRLHRAVVRAGTLAWRWGPIATRV